MGSTAGRKTPQALRAMLRAAAAPALSMGRDPQATKCWRGESTRSRLSTARSTAKLPSGQARDLFLFTTHNEPSVGKPTPDPADCVPKRERRHPLGEDVRPCNDFAPDEVAKCCVVRGDQ